MLAVIASLLSCTGSVKVEQQTETKKPQLTLAPEDTGTGDAPESDTSASAPESDTSAGDVTADDTTAAPDEETTAPPETEPPVTGPAETQPSDTEAPVTQPPETQPPVTQPPQTEPPVTQTPVVPDSEQHGGGSIGIGGATGEPGKPDTTPVTPPVTTAPSNDTQAPTPDTNPVTPPVQNPTPDTQPPVIKPEPPKEDPSQVSSGDVPVHQSASTKDSTTKYITTKTGKKLVHTYSDRAVDAGEDNSKNYTYIPLLSVTNFPKADADYNNASAMIKDIKPGLKWNHVIVGYDGYMFYEDTIEDFNGRSVLNGSVYNRAKEMLESSQKWAESHGMKFYIVIAPNKNTVYPDYMPEGYQIASYRRYDQFVELINDAGITAVDLRDAMAQSVQAAPEKNLYYKYDTHWNNHAGFIAYQTTMNMIKKDFPNVVIHQKSEYQVNYVETYMKDQAYYLGQYSYYKDYGPVYTLKSPNTATLVDYDPIQGWGQFAFAYEVTSGKDKGFSDKLKWLQYENEYNKNAPNAYVLRDSYSIAMIPFMKDSFHLSTYNWTFSLNQCKSEILANDTDVIIAVIAERNLKNYVNQKEVSD